MNKSMGNIEYTSLLYDFYGDLLDDAKREVMNLYHEDDMSLAEIAEELGQSRQAVHYTLKKAEDKLNHFEDKLGLVANYMDNLELAGEAAVRAQRLLDSSNLTGSEHEDVEFLESMIERLVLEK